jgi:hypothetical protein
MHLPMVGHAVSTMNPLVAELADYIHGWIQLRVDFCPCGRLYDTLFLSFWSPYLLTALSAAVYGAPFTNEGWPVSKVHDVLELDQSLLGTHFSEFGAESCHHLIVQGAIYLDFPVSNGQVAFCLPWSLSY